MMFFMVFVVGLAGLVNMSRVCDSGWMAFNNNCYRFSTTTAPFKGALSNCINIGSNLIEFSGKMEENWLLLQSEIRGYKNIWIGLTDILFANRYVLASTGVQPPYSNWARGQPQRGNKEHCASVYVPQRKWHDYPCDTRMYYICKKPANHYA
uniref:Perlucin-like protein isoform X1 n=1 Tax=Crassostrea virginica TaxID=6565 RepID=A0A8B8C140_CRAVI|nr:perlucin-like protein isoform X1 [Crassostrea virginica]